MENNIPQRPIPPRPPIKVEMQKAEEKKEEIQNDNLNKTQERNKIDDVTGRKEKFVLHSQTKAFILLFASAICTIFAIILFIFLLK